MDYSRSYSPVPPPCPSPQLSPLPLPTPPIYTRRPSLTPPSSSSSDPNLPPSRPKIKQSPAASSESLVFSLKDAIVAGSPSRRRFSEHASFRHPSSSQDSFDRRPRTADLSRPLVNVSSPDPNSFKRKHRQSESITQTSDISFPPSSPTSRSLSRKRTRSPTGRPVTSVELPPPVPPLPPLPPLPSKREGRSSLFSKKLPSLRIPELGLGLDEKLRSPLSPLKSGISSRRRESHTKAVPPEGMSFLNMSPKKQVKRRPGRSSLGDHEPLSPSVSISVRSTHSLPDIKAAKRRSNPSFTSRIFRLGTQQMVH